MIELVPAPSPLPLAMRISQSRRESVGPVLDPVGEIVSRNEPLREASDGLAVDEENEQRNAPDIEAFDERWIVARVY